MSPVVTCPNGHTAATRLAADRPDYVCSECMAVFVPQTTTAVADMIPDMLGEVIGWRAWHLADTSDGMRLTSTGYGGKYSQQLWIPGEPNEALCHKGSHTPPSPSCSCGFYAARTRDHLLSLNTYHLYGPGTKAAVACIGQVAMDGQVIPATLGWRAQYAWPLNVLVPYEHWRYVAPLREAYAEWGVEVVLDNTLMMPASDGPRWCRKCGCKIKPRAPKCHVCGTLVEDRP